MMHTRSMALASVGMALLCGSVVADDMDRPPVPVVIARLASTDLNTTDTETVLDFLKRYESTLASGRVERIVTLYADFDPKRQAELENYFQTVVSGFQVRLDDVDIRSDGERARVSFARTDSFDDRETGKHVEKGVSIARKLERHGSTWQMVLDGQ